MRENLKLTSEAFAKVKTFEELMDALTPPLSERLGGGRAGDYKAFQTISNLASVRKRIFSFDEYRRETGQFYGEEFFSYQTVKNMLNALRDVRIVYGNVRSRFFIRRRFYRKFSQLVIAHDKEEAKEIEMHASSSYADF